MPVTIDTTAGAVTLFECYDGFRKGIDLSAGPYVEQDYVLAAADWNRTDQVCNALMGGTSASGASVGTGGAIIRIPGFPCPTSPNLTCVDAVCIGEGENCSFDGGHVRFNLPKIRAKYGIRSWQQLTVEDPGGLQGFPNSDSPGTPYTYADMSIDFHKQEQKIPGSAYQFTSPTLPCDVPFFRRVGSAKMNFTRKRVPFLPTLTIMKLLNNLNNNTFFGAPMGQILFSGARTTKLWESDGTILQDVSLEFLYQEWDWNKFLRPDTGQPDFPTSITGGFNVYSYADLTPLLLS